MRYLRRIGRRSLLTPADGIALAKTDRGPHAADVDDGTAATGIDHGAGTVWVMNKIAQSILK